VTFSGQELPRFGKEDIGSCGAFRIVTFSGEDVLLNMDLKRYQCMIEGSQWAAFRSVPFHSIRELMYTKV